MTDISVNLIEGTAEAEQLNGTNSLNLPDLIKGLGGDDTLSGGEGHDTLLGGTGNDLLKGGAGDDNLSGDQGDDTYVWDGGSDIIYDMSGNDTVLLGGKVSDFHFSVNWSTGHLTIARADGATLTIRSYFGFTPALTGEPPAGSEQLIEKIVFDDGTTWGRNEVVNILKPAGQSFKGTDHNEVIIGTMGDDTIDGSIGTHSMRGGLGDDTYLWGPGTNKLVGAPGDTVEDFSGNDTVVFGYDFSSLKFATDREGVNLWIAAPDGQTLIIENYFDFKNPSGPSLSGPVETLRFADGAVKTLADIQTIVTKTVGGEAKDVLTGGGGTELLSGRGGNDTIRGNAGADLLLGGSGSDTLAGGAGNDVLLGGAGADLLTGGAGRDKFIFDAARESGPSQKRMDVIADFRHGIDRIDLQEIDANKAASGNNKFLQLLTGHQTFTKAGQLHYDAHTGILSGNTDKDAAAEFQIQLKNKPLILTLNDFVL